MNRLDPKSGESVTVGVRLTPADARTLDGLAYFYGTSRSATLRAILRQRVQDEQARLSRKESRRHP